MQPLHFSPLAILKHPGEENRRGKIGVLGFQRVRETENGREWDERVGERSKSSFLQRRGGEELFDGQERELLFISAPTLRTAPLGVRKGNRDLLQHEDRGQLLAGSRGRPCFRVRTRESSPGNGEPLYPDGGTGGALRCLTLLETYRSFNGLFNALFSR